MQEIIIDRDFQYLLPMLDEKTFLELEADILENGIRDALILWDGILIDGYNRYSIAKKHNLPFETLSMEFKSRDEVTIWIIRNQIARRNLTPFQLRYFRGLHFHADRRSQGENNPHIQEGTKRQNGGLLRTSQKLGEKYKVSSRTIERDSVLAEALLAVGEVSPEAKLSILSGETRITRKELEELLAGTGDEIAEVAKNIDNGTFNERKTDHISNQEISLEAAFSKMTGTIQRELRGLAKTFETSEVKSALRSHILSLEEIYKQM